MCVSPPSEKASKPPSDSSIDGYREEETSHAAPGHWSRNMQLREDQRVAGGKAMQGNESRKVQKPEMTRDQGRYLHKSDGPLLDRAPRVNTSGCDWRSGAAVYLDDKAV